MNFYQDSPTMPTGLDPLFDADSPSLPLSLSDQQHARDGLELVSLRATVASLLEESRLGHRLAAVASSGALQGEVAAVATARNVQASCIASEVHRSGARETLPQPEFLSMLAHELRNPLHSMKMANQLLTSPSQSAQTVAQVHGVLDRQIGHMSRLLDDLLDASRAVNGKIILQPGPVLLRDVINAAVETSSPDVQRRAQDLEVVLPDHDITVTGDFTRLAQVFSNLLVNASQFSNQGGKIDVFAVCHGDVVEITVKDDGAGIPAELQPFVFDMFTQGQRTLERVQGGMGIGLSLVRTIVQLHGGSSAVSSPGIGAGSTFTITLPLAVVLAPAEPHMPDIAPAHPSRNILIIEDNVDANEMLAMLLEMDGHTVTSSFDGGKGLQLASEGKFDIVLCDLGLPTLNGFEVVAALKAGPAGEVFVIATTGYSDGAQRDLARAAGFDHYLVKPIDLAALKQVILTYAN